MTNQIKAPRPCTVDKMKPNTTFDTSSGVKELEVIEREDLYSCYWQVLVTFIDGTRTWSDYFNTSKEAYDLLNDLIQAIASAQRPWLKAEGFEFVNGNRYHVLCRNGSFDYVMLFNEGSFYDTSGYYYEVGSIIAFQPALHPLTPKEKVQESWEAVAGVEVYKEGE